MKKKRLNFEGLQVFQMPEEHQVKIRTTKLAERINGELKSKHYKIPLYDLV